MKKNRLIELINDTGYPLQISIEDQVRQAQSKWRIVAPEHHWSDSESVQDGFIDLVIGQPNFRLVVECKKIDGDWIFLLPKQAAVLKTRTRLLEVDMQHQVYPAHHSGAFQWVDKSFTPHTHESIYCVTLNIQDIVCGRVFTTSCAV